MDHRGASPGGCGGWGAGGRAWARSRWDGWVLGIGDLTPPRNLIGTERGGPTKGPLFLAPTPQTTHAALAGEESNQSNSEREGPGRLVIKPEATGYLCDVVMNLFSKENLEKESFKGNFCRTCLALIPALDLLMALAALGGDSRGRGGGDTEARGSRGGSPRLGDTACGALGSLWVRGSSRDSSSRPQGPRAKARWALLSADRPAPMWAQGAGVLTLHNLTCSLPRPSCRPLPSRPSHF